jgi:hypothetical protein
MDEAHNFSFTVLRIASNISCESGVGSFRIAFRLTTCQSSQNMEKGRAPVR